MAKQFVDELNTTHKIIDFRTKWTGADAFPFRVELLSDDNEFWYTITIEDAALLSNNLSKYRKDVCFNFVSVETGDLLNISGWTSKDVFEILVENGSKKTMNAELALALSKEIIKFITERTNNEFLEFVDQQRKQLQTRKEKNEKN